MICSFFFFNDTATTEIYTLSLHDALPILPGLHDMVDGRRVFKDGAVKAVSAPLRRPELPQDDGEFVMKPRSEEHTSELQSRQYLVCRLLLEKKKNIYYIYTHLSSTPFAPF